jgi:hypothetical protein
MEEIYDSARVDLTVIRWMLSLTPPERLATFEDFIDFALKTWQRNGIRPTFLAQDTR